MRDGVIRGGEDGAVRVVRCGQAVGGTVCEGRSARSNRSTGALGAARNATFRNDMRKEMNVVLDEMIKLRSEMTAKK